IAVVLKNTSNFIWSSKAENPIVFSYQWLDADDKIVVWNGERTDLPQAVSPQESIRLNATIKAPALPGTYTLRLTLVQEKIAWFDEQGATTKDKVVKVIAN
ncbi:MAG TPA: hypothetical protein V6D04_11365, partial [Candidatus Obscuribacterales bacterium]